MMGLGNHAATVAILAAGMLAGCQDDMARAGGDVTTIAMTLGNHPSAPSAIWLEANGVVLDRARIGGTTDIGSTPTDSPVLRYRVAWIELFGTRAWSGGFEVPVGDLSITGAEEPLADIRIVLGPGADITVNTADPASPEAEDGIRLVEACAKALPAHNARRRTLERGKADADLDWQRRLLDGYRQGGGTARSRCGG